MRQRGHPTRTMEVASGLFEYIRAWPWSASPELRSDKHELGGDVGEFDDDTDPFGDSMLIKFTRGGDRFSFSSSFGLLLPFQLIVSVHLKTCGSWN